MSVSREKVGYTMKSMKPVRINVSTSACQNKMFLGHRNMNLATWWGAVRKDKYSSMISMIFKSAEIRIKSTPIRVVAFEKKQEKGNSYSFIFSREQSAYKGHHWHVLLGVCETYRSGTRLPECFSDHTEERRAGPAPPLYHPHKDRKRERKHLKERPTHRLEITSWRLFDFNSSNLRNKQNHVSACVVSHMKEDFNGEVSHVLFSRRTGLNTSSVLFLFKVQSFKPMFEQSLNIPEFNCFVPKGQGGKFSFGFNNINQFSLYLTHRVDVLQTSILDESWGPKVWLQQTEWVLNNLFMETFFSRTASTAYTFSLFSLTLTYWTSLKVSRSAS